MAATLGVFATVVRTWRKTPSTVYPPAYVRSTMERVPRPGWNSGGRNLSSSTVPQGAFLGNGIIGSRLLMREEQDVATPERRA